MFHNLLSTALKAGKRSKRRGRIQASARRAQGNRLQFESLEPRLVLDSYSALQRPTELQYWDATKADNGYNFYGVGGTSYLLDMEGRVVHTWPIGNNPHLLANGDVLDASTNDPSGFSGFKEVSWDGTTVWSYLESRSTYHPHHDFTRIFNPKLNAYTTLYIANKDLTYDQLVAAGANPNTAPSTGAQMDALVEVDSSGTIVWEWCFFDHLIQDFDSSKSNYVGTGKTIADYPNRLDINLDGHNLKADWLHCNSLDYNQSLDQIDYTGFQYLRDNDPDNMGHNTSFLTRVANNVIYTLNDTQLKELQTLATAQLSQFNLYAYKRFALMEAFRSLMDGDIPSGSTGLNLDAVKSVSRELYLLDGQISFDRALLYARIINSLDSTQKAYLDAMQGKGFNSWPNITNDQIQSKMQSLPQGTAQLVMTYASDLFSWYAGSVDADVYFCPERHGTYYGGFYMKDAPAVGHEGYSISETLTATAGAALSDVSRGYVTQAQADMFASLLNLQKK